MPTNEGTTLYVVHRGRSNGGRKIPAAVFEEKEYAEGVYQRTLDRHLADVNTGYYVTQVENLTFEQSENLWDHTSDVVAGNFEGLKATRIKAYESRIEDWDEAALSVGGQDEAFESGAENERVSFV